MIPIFPIKQNYKNIILLNSQNCNIAHKRKKRRGEPYGRISETKQAVTETRPCLCNVAHLRRGAIVMPLQRFPKAAVFALPVTIF